MEGVQLNDVGIEHTNKVKPQNTQRKLVLRNKKNFNPLNRPQNKSC